MIRFLKAFYLTPRFFYVLSAMAVLFLVSYWWPSLYGWVWLLVFMVFIAMSIESALLFTRPGIKGARLLPEKFSNGDPNSVSIQLSNRYPFSVYVQVIDELPFQFQKRDFALHVQLSAKQQRTLSYELRPVDRGSYTFGNVNCFVTSPVGLIRKRIIFNSGQMVKVYPSFIQMKKYDFLAIDQRRSMAGLKKIRRIGHTMEFEQIKEYVSGDDVRTVNWKATAKKGALMVNQYQDEKMQPIYSVIDSSRIMKMPFEGLKLIDYAINSSLAFSNVALKKGDKVGLIEFSNTIGTFLPAQSKKTHLNTILESLYNIDTQFLDSDYGLLQGIVKKRINHRSLLLLYTNFEHISALRRQLPYLQQLAKKHLLVVVLFENTELKNLIQKEAASIPEIFDQTIAQQFAYDKKTMVLELQQRGIQSLLTSPQDLTVNTINKYLEIKARGLL